MMQIKRTQFLARPTPMPIGALLIAAGWAMTGRAHGHVFVANYSSWEIPQFTAGGVGATFARTGMNGPELIAIQSRAIPEPATTAILAGLAGLVVEFTTRLARADSFDRKT